MHRSRLEYIDDTWNPITGCNCDCRYCYARKNSIRFSMDIRRNLNSLQYEKDGELFILDKPFISETGSILIYPFGFKPTLHRYRLDYPAGRKNGCSILIGDTGETFGDWIPDKWISEIMKSCEEHPEHNFLFLTRNPERYHELNDKGILLIQDNMWYGTTITNTSDIERFNNLPVLGRKFVNIEPILEDIQSKECSINYMQADWIIIGAETGQGREKVTPEWEWIRKIVLKADSFGVPVYMKDSLICIVGEKNMRREIPKRLMHKELSRKLKDKLEDECCQCSTHMRKSNMVSITAKTKRRETPKQLCYMCHPCFTEFCNKLNLRIPEFDTVKE